MTKKEVTPLSLTIHYDMPRKKITKQSYGDDGVTTWEIDEEPWFLYGFRMKDGTIQQMIFQSQEQEYVVNGVIFREACDEHETDSK